MKEKMKKVNILAIPEALYEKYRGTGYGMVSVQNGVVVDLVYFDTIDDSFFIESGIGSNAQMKKFGEIIDDPKTGEYVRYLQSLGEVFVGIFSCYEFCEL
jgi:hypothetical protein